MHQMPDARCQFRPRCQMPVQTKMPDASSDQDARCQIPDISSKAVNSI
jgi:hypothetical protein